jgi:hypothetical protein
MNKFFKNYGVDKCVDVREKYNTPPAEVHPPNHRTPQGHRGSCTHSANVTAQCFLNASRSVFGLAARPSWQCTTPGCLVLPQFYREQLRAEAEGRPYTPPAPSSVKASTAASSRGHSNRPGARSTTAISNGDWRDDSGSANKMRVRVWGVPWLEGIKSKHR